MKLYRKIVTTAVAAVVLFVGIAVTTHSTRADGMPDPNRTSVSKVDPSIIGRWKWTGGETPAGPITPAPRQNYLVSFFQDGSFSMKLEINIVNGDFTADGTAITIEPTMTTMAAWAPASPAPQLIELVSQVETYRIAGDELQLDTASGGSTLFFQRSD